MLRCSSLPETRRPQYDPLQIVSWAAHLGAITAPALARRDGLSLAAARGRLSACRREGLLCAVRPRPDRPTLYTATRAGLRAAGLGDLGPCRVTVGNAAHLSVCAEVAAAMERRHPDQRVEGERELRAQERAGGRSLASARMGVDPAGGPSLHRPDLVLWPVATGSGRPVAVEVELSCKAHRRLVAICRAWARCELVDGVLYCAPANVARSLARAIDEVHGHDRILVLGLRHVLDPSPLPW